MTEPLSISNEPPHQPGQNFALLRKKAIEHLEKLGGNIWTDYNTQDPGITILEQLCYAITDLSYRLDFPIEDLLAPSPETEIKQFFTAREILTVNPLTINDYRKLLIDIDGVKNAWLEPIKNPEPKIYYDTSSNTLSFTPSDSSKKVKLNGLYRVQIEVQEASSEDGIKIYDNSEDYKKNLIATVNSKLNQHRNLCEDFAQIKVLPFEDITVKAEIEIQEGQNVNELMAKIYFALDAFISPDLQFYTLKELLLKGRSTEEIFNGPPLEHGFLDDEELESFSRKKELHTSDLIQIILDVQGIKAIKNITIFSDFLPEEKSWIFPLNMNKIPKIITLEKIVNDKHINFTKNQISCNLDLNQIRKEFNIINQEKQKQRSRKKSQDLPVPTGKYRELSAYRSIQEDFPTNYGIGELGLAASVSEKRKAQAKQLQAYLMFFEQILTNYFAQLDGVKYLFSSANQNLHTYSHTYFIQKLTNLPGFKEIFQGDYTKLQEDKAVFLERKNRFLDHLIAQYCEKFTDYNLLLSGGALKDKGGEKVSRIDLEEKYLDHKIDFLKNYPQISSRRNSALNYSKFILGNVSGFKQRICSLLCIDNTQEEDFYIVEHILLRPVIEKWEQEAQALDPYSFQLSFIFPNWSTCFKDENFKQLIYNIISSELPSHITPYYHWLDNTAMENFKINYINWLNLLSKKPKSQELQDAINKLVTMLKIGQE